MRTNGLHIDFTLLPHPYPTDPSASREAWGEIRFTVVGATQSANLLTWQWDLADYAEWFVNNYEHLRHEGLSLDVESPEPGESLAHTDSRLRERAFEDDESEFRWFDQLGMYGEHHNLRNSLPGTPIPPIFLGMNHGYGEISLNLGQDEWWPIAERLRQNLNFGPWAHQFEMDAFLDQSKTKINAVLGEWYAEAPHLQAKVRAASLLKN